MDALLAFTQDHIPEITGTVGLVSYALLRNKLTPAGIAAGIFVAGVHMLHPWRAFFWLLIIFFVLGTGVTRVGQLSSYHAQYLCDIAHGPENKQVSRCSRPIHLFTYGWHMPFIGRG